jgi:hypothetical protein
VSSRNAELEADFPMGPGDDRVLATTSTATHGSRGLGVRGVHPDSRGGGRAVTPFTGQSGAGW